MQLFLSYSYDYNIACLDSAEIAWLIKSPRQSSLRVVLADLSPYEIRSLELANRLSVRSSEKVFTYSMRECLQKAGSFEYCFMNSLVLSGSSLLFS